MTQRSVNAFRALGRIILHRSVRVTSGPYFAHNTVYAYRLFFHNPLFHRPVMYRSSYKYIYLLIGFRVVGILLSSELDKFSSPWLEKNDRAFFSRQVRKKTLLETTFIPVFPPF